MGEYISPIDRHRHFGGAGRAECAVCCLEAERDHERGLRQGLDRLANTLFEERNEARGERDRLRDDLYRERGVKQVKDVALLDVLAERDRLRAVVGAARAYVEAEVDDQCPDAEYFRDGLVAALAALDGSAEATDG